MSPRAIGIAVAAVVLPVTATFGSVIDVGLAGEFAAFASNHADMTLSSGNTLVEGNVGVGPGGSFSFSGGGLVTGRFDHHPDVSVTISGGSQVLGGINAVDMAQVDADAYAASMAARMLAPTQTLGDVSGGTIVGGGGVNVVEIANIDLGGGATFTLEGGTDDVFIINVTGDFSLSGGSEISLAGELDASRVLFNIIDPGSEVSLTGDSTLFGTILATERNITISGGYIEGAVIGCGDFLKLQSGPHVVFNGFTTVPGPAGLALFGLACGRRRRRRDA